MPLSTANDIVDRRATGFTDVAPFSLEVPVATTATLYTNALNLSVQNMGVVYEAPNPLPAGVSNISINGGWMTSNTALCSFWFARLINYGSINLATNVFTAGVVAPSRLECNVSRQIATAVFIEAETATGTSNGTLVVDYVDEDNASGSTPSMTLTANVVKQTAQFMELGDANMVKQITGAVRTGGASPSGTLRFWGIDPIDILPIPNIVQPEIFNTLTSMPFRTPLDAGEKVYVLCIGNSTTKSILGGLALMGETP